MTGAAEASGKTYLVFQSGQGWYAVSAASATEVVDLPELRQLPGSPAHIRGVFVHRGEVIPAVDLALLAGEAENAGSRAVLLRQGEEAIALIANAVAGMSEIAGDLEPFGGTGVLAHLMGPAPQHDKSPLVIDVPGLFELLSRR